MPARTTRLWPAEWEPHSATWIGWPHHDPDWPGKFEPIRWVYAEIVRALHEYEPVQILCHSEEIQDQAVAALHSHGVRLDRCRVHRVPSDRVWLRDSGPTMVWREGGSVEAVCWRFNAWAKYDNHRADALIAPAVAQLAGIPTVEAVRADDGSRLVLEGGAIDTNGNGVLLTTEECLLSTIQERNSGLDRAGYERAFREYLGIHTTIWLGEGCVGDDTHGHVDDVARFVAPNTVVLAFEPDPDDANHERSLDNRHRLDHAARGLEGGLRVIDLPYPRPVIMDGERLPASYANFYIANGVVIVPTFNDVNDRVALNILAECFPGRDVIGINSVDLVWGLGTLHCLTQQQPASRT